MDAERETLRLISYSLHVSVPYVTLSVCLSEMARKRKGPCVCVLDFFFVLVLERLSTSVLGCDIFLRLEFSGSVADLGNALMLKKTRCKHEYMCDKNQINISLVNVCSCLTILYMI